MIRSTVFSYTGRVRFATVGSHLPTKTALLESHLPNLLQSFSHKFASKLLHLAVFRISKPTDPDPFGYENFITDTDPDPSRYKL